MPAHAAPVRSARFLQEGVLRASVRSERWLPFTARHTVQPLDVAFDWDARVRIAPLLHVRVQDSLAGGRGAGRVKLMSLVTLASAAGTPQMNSGSLHRFLGEAPWYPSALLPSESLRWRELDDGAAIATLTHSGSTVSLEFRFNAASEVAGIYTPARWGRFAGRYQQRAWEGHFMRYRRRAGMLVPDEGEVGWYDAGSWQCVWRGRILEASY